MKTELLRTLTKLLEDNVVPPCLVRDKISFRRAHVVRLTLLGFKQMEIAQRIGCSLSTIEKDVCYLRNQV